MTNAFKSTWETYNSSWKAESADEKRAIFQTCLSPTCVYNDPLATTKGWEELVNYMTSFHEQVPGGHFETHYFLAHNNQSIARWHMKDGKEQIIGEGMSYGKYDKEGKLISMTGFFENP